MLNQQTIEKLHAIKLHGLARCLPRSTGNHRSQPARLRRTLRAAGRSAVAVERKPCLGAAAAGCPPERARRHRRCRLPASPRPGSQISPHPFLQRLGAPASQRPAVGTNRHRENLAGLCTGAESLPRWLLRVAQTRLGTVSRTGASIADKCYEALARAAAKWQPSSKALRRTAGHGTRPAGGSARFQRLNRR